eukprot:7380996-Prymnesium_polylepis.2
MACLRQSSWMSSQRILSVGVDCSSWSAALCQPSRGSDATVGEIVSGLSCQILATVFACVLAYPRVSGCEKAACAEGSDWMTAIMASRLLVVGFSFFDDDFIEVSVDDWVAAGHPRLWLLHVRERRGVAGSLFRHCDVHRVVFGHWPEQAEAFGCDVPRAEDAVDLEVNVLTASVFLARRQFLLVHQDVEQFAGEGGFDGRLLGQERQAVFFGAVWEVAGRQVGHLDVDVRPDVDVALQTASIRFGVSGWSWRAGVGGTRLCQRTVSLEHAFAATHPDHRVWPHFSYRPPARRCTRPT